MAEDRTPAIRKPRSRTELAQLHPVERTVYRVFEFVSSIRLAMIVLPWLILECIAGATLESRVNTEAARYFVYWSPRFYACLGLLTLNIFCAALIRFPWKRYQTGFVVTHIGLLIIMFGSFITLRHYVDALIVASKLKSDSESDRWVNRAFDPQREYLEVVDIDLNTGESKHVEAIPLDLGPFTWGDRIFGIIPWRKGYSESHKLSNGDEIRILEFYSNCDREDAYVPAEKGLKGTPALRVKFSIGSRDAFDEWIPASEFSRPMSVLNVGKIHVRKLATEEHWQHVVKAQPKPFAFETGDDGGLYGWLTISGKVRYRFKVDELKTGKAIPIPGTKDTIEVIQYFADAKPGPKPGTLVDGGADPDHPGLKIRLIQEGKPIEYFCSSDFKINRQLSAAQPGSYQFEYRPVGSTSIGWIALTAGSQHEVVSLDELQSGPRTISGTDLEIELKQYLPDATVDSKQGGLISQSDQPRNPAAVLGVRKAGQSINDCFIFADPQFDAMVDGRRPFRGSLYVPRLQPLVEVFVSPSGELAYRASSRSAFIGGGMIEPKKQYPVWPVPQMGQTLSFSVESFIPNGRLDAKLYPKPLVPRETGQRGAVVEIRTPQGKATLNLNRHTETVQGGIPVVLQWPDRMLRIRLAHQELTLPFSIRLEDFIQPNIPGSMKAAMYSSIVKVKENDRELKDPYLITMNQPLRYTATGKEGGSVFHRLFEAIIPQSYALYQTSISQTEDGPISTFTVSRAPGTVLIYSGVIVSVIGMFLMFYMGGYFRKPRQAETSANEIPSEDHA